MFRVSVTLFLEHRNEIMACDEITVLAALLRNIVKNADTTNCHEFMQKIFRIPGRLRRRDIANNEIRQERFTKL